MTGYGASVNPERAFSRAQQLDLTVPDNMVLYSELMRRAENATPSTTELSRIINTSLRSVEPIKVEKAEPEPPRSGRTPLNLNIVRGAAEH